MNLHNSPLPKYRGLAPINWALKNKEIEHGVTIHEVVDGIDSGPIVSQVKFSIFPNFDTVSDIYFRSLRYGWELFKRTMPVLDKIKPRKQNEKLATYYDKEKKRLVDEKGFTMLPLDKG